MLGDEIGRKLDRMLNDLEFIKNRISSYLGDGIALTYLADETPIYVNANDFGCPANFINGGKYEEENFWILGSFIAPTTVFLDIGANLGVFSLRLAPRIKSGRIIAFEPHPKVFSLMKRSVFLNGYTGVIETRNVALSDKNSEERLRVPAGHVGGGSLHIGNTGDVEEFVCKVTKLDDIVPEGLACDVVKLDVEGHELSVLNGMRGVLERSADKVKVLFEKLGTNVGPERDLYTFFKEFGLSLFRVEPPYQLVATELSEFMARSGYFLAVRSELVANRLHRGFISIYPLQLNVLGPNSIGAGGNVHIRGRVVHGAIMWHGPYWHLPKGYYRMRIVGRVGSGLNITVAERFGYPVTTFSYTPTHEYIDFPNERDLSKFELIVRADSTDVNVELERVELEKLA